MGKGSFTKMCVRLLLTDQITNINIDQTRKLVGKMQTILCETKIKLNKQKYMKLYLLG